MRILRLRTKNYQKIKVVDITPDRNINNLIGRNAQGKTSVINSIYAALGGKRAMPDKPIRDGEVK